MYDGQQPWLYTSLAGVTLGRGKGGAGFRNMRIAPRVPRGLGGVALRLRTVNGEIGVQWPQGNATTTVADTGDGSGSSTGVGQHRNTDICTFMLSVDIPIGIHASVCPPLLQRQLPGSVTVLEGGKVAWDHGEFAQGVAGVSSGRVSSELNAVCFAVGSGTYTFYVL
jgi:hypothetical protein